METEPAKPRKKPRRKKKKPPAEAPVESAEGDAPPALLDAPPGLGPPTPRAVDAALSSPRRGFPAEPAAPVARDGKGKFSTVEDELRFARADLPLMNRGDVGISVETCRGDATAATWLFRGETPRPRDGYSEKTSRGAAESPRRGRPAKPPPQVLRLTQPARPALQREPRGEAVLLRRVSDAPEGFDPRARRRDVGEPVHGAVLRVGGRVRVIAGPRPRRFGRRVAAVLRPRGPIGRRIVAARRRRRGSLAAAATRTHRRRGDADPSNAGGRTRSPAASARRGRGWASSGASTGRTRSRSSSTSDRELPPAPRSR